MSSTSPPLPVADASAPAPDAPHARTVLAVGSLGFFLITLDISIVNVALPNITRELGGGTSGQQWTIDGYTLLFAALLLFAGNLTDRIGAKKALGLGIVNAHPRAAHILDLTGLLAILQDDTLPD